MASSAAAGPAEPAAESLRASLGAQGVVDVDPLTGTPRVVARLDGFLTAPADGDPRDLVLAYVRDREDVFGLDGDDLAGLRLVRDETDAFGVRHLLWAQEAGGVRAFANDLRASVAPDGRILNVLGAPIPDLELPAGAAAVSAGGAVAAALRDAGRPVAVAPRALAAPRGAARATRFAGGHEAALVLVATGRGVRLAWRVTADVASDEVYTSLVAADSGEVLASANKVEDVDAIGEAWEYYPGAASGGTAALSNWTAKGWLPADSTTLNGPYARVFADLDDDDGLDAGEEATEFDSVWDYNLDVEEHPEGFCAPNPGFTSICTWDSTSQASWSPNRKQNSTQVFHFVNTFHDHLKLDPDIAWTTRVFENGDKVVAHSNDGAATGVAGQFLGTLMPDVFHVSNANMFTPPDGQSPRMQMYLFTSFTGVFATDPTPDVNGGDDAAVVYHEYTHGLSNRLVTYADGWGALDAFQSGAMGEGWSDWYAMDYLVDEGYAPDTAAAGEVTLDRYLGNGQRTLRTEGLDCPAGSADAACPGGDDTGNGGYTFGDMGHVWSGGAEVHADGEIWAQTLWDLRDAVGVADARFLVTEGMRLSPRNPSFLDMRNAILQANQVGVLDGRSDHEATIWGVFAARGMGFFAATEDAEDTSPIESFALPPDPGDGVGSLAGVVTDADTGKPVAGVTVSFAGVGFADSTDSLGRYAIADVPAGTYPQVVAAKAGYERDVETGVGIVADTEGVVDLEVRRDWAAYDGGGRIHAFTGPNFSAYGCGPVHAIDQSTATGWSTIRPTIAPTGARSITVKLPAYVNVSSFAVDPGAVCGDPDSASAQGYKIETSKTGASGSWAVVKTGSFTLGQAHQLNAVSIALRKAVRYVRFTITSNHGHAEYMDLAELVVHGTPTPTCLGLPATKVGTNAANTITGGSGADVIVGLGGNDKINGKGGKDVICGGPGNDTLTGGPGVDKLDGGDGADVLYSRDSVKELTVRGGAGTDRARKDKADKTTSVERLF
ncbi:MAG TPA: M36 family metallopeptidase [Gaiellaceae bacterium]|nr:M36 family metallopeptidase [Gaiellaceae bacterium]